MLVDLVSRLGSNFLCLFPFFFSFIVDIVPFLFSWIPCHFLSCFIPIDFHLTLVARALASDVFLLSIQEIYIDVVPDVVIQKVNWLHYLNYEVVPRTSSTSH